MSYAVLAFLAATESESWPRARCSSWTFRSPRRSLWWRGLSQTIGVYPEKRCGRPWPVDSLDPLRIGRRRSATLRSCLRVCPHPF